MTLHKYCRCTPEFRASDYVDCPLERAHRDIYAVMQHVQLAPMWQEAAGRVRLGLLPQHPWFGL